MNNITVNEQFGLQNQLKQVKKKKKKSKLKSFIVFLIFEFLFMSLTTPLLVFYGPFNNVKRTIIGMTWNSFTLQKIPKAFLSDNAISRILGDGYAISDLDTEAIKMLKFGVKHTGEIELFDVESSNFKGKMLLIEDPTRIKVGYSNQMPRAGETTSSIAKRNGAIAAINGGGFIDTKWAGTGGAPLGYLISNGKYISGQIKDKDKKRDTIAFTEDGMLIVGKHSENDLNKYKVKEAISFGPPLIVNGKPTVKGDGGWGISPRTVIGQKEDGSVLMLVIDGRSLKSFGATLEEVQNIMLKHGAVNAANLDGGSSTTMYYDGKVINTPSDALGERSVPSVFMVMP
ncbi:phosphodiester glycosidase family protein [Ruminiclostridium cellobioparum]|uniref:Exopolysaccharide biosynthesis protein n=1 Tax=Ruminiclostridium cellobioparum subsp. termitidis CT1112 TaxID=1195236 RepID=S0FFI1_RUMCE|nr:phosphodiester glycosidase family protein [Ruminiclostridium cellobioparum]EMS69700.1 exopolysaccharide biosynthesis protein [Ruminiclostridium cellobioparum subsp. termitidis CT1112]